MRAAWKSVSCARAPARGLAFGVLRTLAGLVAAVLFAFDLARVAGQHPALAQRRAQSFGGDDQRARDSVTHGFGLGRDAAAADAYDHVVMAFGLGEFEGFHDLHARGVARKIDLERAFIDADGAGAGREPHPCDRALAFADRPDFRLLVCHLALVPSRSLSAARSPIAGLELDLLRLLRGMRMIRPAINLELGKEPPSEPVLRQHPAHRRLQQALGAGLHQPRRGGRADAARIARVAAVDLALELVAREAHFAGVDDDDEVASVLMGCEVGTMLAAEHARRARRDAAERPFAGVNQHPAPIAQCVFVRNASGLFTQFQLFNPRAWRPRPSMVRIIDGAHQGEAHHESPQGGTAGASKFWRGRWDLNPRLP